MIFSAAVRLKGTSFWQVMVFLFEASVFVLIGFSLRDILERAGGVERVLADMAAPLLAIVVSLTLARLAWIWGSDMLLRGLTTAGIGQEAPLGRPHWSWAGPACAAWSRWRSR